MQHCIWCILRSTGSLKIFEGLRGVEANILSTRVKPLFYLSPGLSSSILQVGTSGARISPGLVHLDLSREREARIEIAHLEIFPVFLKLPLLLQGRGHFFSHLIEDAQALMTRDWYVPS